MPLIVLIFLSGVHLSVFFRYKGVFNFESLTEVLLGRHSTHNRRRNKGYVLVILLIIVVVNIMGAGEHDVGANQKTSPYGLQLIIPTNSVTHHQPHTTVRISI